MKGNRNTTFFSLVNRFWKINPQKRFDQQCFFCDPCHSLICQRFLCDSSGLGEFVDAMKLQYLVPLVIILAITLWQYYFWSNQVLYRTAHQGGKVSFPTMPNCKSWSTLLEGQLVPPLQSTVQWQIKSRSNCLIMIQNKRIDRHQTTKKTTPNKGRHLNTLSGFQTLLTFAWVRIMVRVGVKLMRKIETKSSNT